MEGLQVSEGLVAMTQGTQVYLPVRALALALEFPVELQPGQAAAYGWFLDDSRRYRIAAGAGRVTREGDTRAFADDAFLTAYLEDRGELYVRPAVLDHAWPLDVTVSQADLAVKIQPDEPLPLQQRRAREARQDALRARREPEAPDAPRQANAYGWLRPPVAALDLQARGGGGRQSTRQSLRWSQDLAGVNVAGGVFASGRTFADSEVRDARLTLRRFAGDDSMPGGLERIAAGDVSGEAFARIGSVGNGRGISLSSFPLTRGSAYDRHSLAGNAPPGWEVELYRDERLLDFQTVGEEGRYRFDGIELAYGVNRLRVVFYGPQGQQRVRTETIDVGQTQARPGETHARLDHVEAGRDFVPVGAERDQAQDTEPGTSLQVVHGFSRQLSLEGGVVDLPASGRQPASRYALVGAAGALGPTATRLRVLGQQSGGTGLDLDSRLRTGPISVRFGGGLFDGFTSPRVGYGTGARKGDLDLGLRAPVPLGERQLFLSARYRFSESVAGTRRHRLDFTQRWNTAGIAWNHAVRYRVANAETGQWSARLGASDRWLMGTGDSVRWSAALEYAQDAGVTGGRLRTRYRFSRDTTLGAQVRHATASGTTRGGLDLTHRWDHARLSVTLHGGEGAGVWGGLRYSVGLAPEGDSGYTLAEPTAPRRGALAVHAFVDRDSDGRFDAGEPPVPNAQLQQPLHRSAATGENGRMVMHDLEAHRRYRVALDPASLEHPFWLPAGDGRQLTVRPGSVPVVELPVEETGAVSGTVRLGPEGATVPGIPLRLVDGDGTTVATTTSIFGGFFSFKQVPHGDYELQLDEARGYGLRERPQRVSVSSAEPMAAGVALAVEQRATTDPATDTDKALAGGGDRSPGQGGRRTGVQGTVFVDAEDGRRPASDVSVRALDGAGEVVERTRTRADGRYRFDELTPGRYVIRVADQATAAAEETVVIGPRRRVIEGIALTAAAQQAAPSTDTAAAKPVHRTLRGTVRAGSETTPRPMAAVRIRLLDERGQVMQQTRSDAEGRYRFERVAAGRYRVHAPAGKTDAATHVRTVTVEAGSGPIRVAALTVAGPDHGDGGSSREAAQPGASIRGSVRRAADGTQQAVAGVRVRLLDVRGQVVQQTHATAAGKYRFNGVAPGRYNVKVARDPSKAGDSVRAITVEPGQGVTQVQPLTAERDPVDREKTADAEAITPSKGAIRGTVYVRHNGAYYQASGVRVRLLDRRGQVVRQGESAGNGRYRFTGVPTGRYEVHVPNGAQTGADSHVERVRLTAGEAGVRGVDVVVAPGHVGQVGRRRSVTGANAPEGRIADAGIPGNWLAAQGPGRYTIQLSGLQTRAAARAFIERHGLAGRALYLRTQHDGERWFPVLYGSFDTLAAARSARARLPASLKKAGPWLRPIDQLRSGAAPAAAEANSTPGTAWLSSQAPMRYGLQLTAAHDEEAVRAFIERHGLSGRAIYFRSWHEGRPWFCVLYGTFPDEAAARAARDRLPADLRPEETWVRSLRSIQRDRRKQ